MTDLPGGPVGQTYDSGQGYGHHGQHGAKPKPKPSLPSPPDKHCACVGVVHCRCYPACGLTEAGGTVRRLLQELERELANPPRFPDASKDARTDLEKAVQDAEKEYQGLDDVVKKYREYHRKIDCELENARTWCEDLRNWCRGVCEDEIAALWRDSYEKREQTLRCAWLKARDTLRSTRDCLEQSGARVEWAREDYNAVKGYEEELKKRFANLKALYDKAKGFVESNEPKAVCAILVEYRVAYARLGELLLKAHWDRWYKHYCDPGKNEAKLPPDSCTPPAEILDADQLREKLIRTLKALLVAQYCRFCWHQQRIDQTAEQDRAKTDLDKFARRRSEDFIREARDVVCKPKSGAMDAAADEAGWGGGSEDGDEDAAAWDGAPGEEDDVSWEITAQDESADGEAEDEPYTEQP